ncbi:MAG: hypothetical protein IPH18_07615 [Chitinophagaceae bacterium]|nr:hypothetical protein [Chitinophagaceae bacterium]
MKAKRKKGFRLLAFLVLAIWLSSGKLEAQQIAVDRGVRVEGLWCFPLITDSLQYLFLPDRSLLAVDERKQPQFSFIRYVTPSTAVAGDGSSIVKAGGGGVLHFLVLYDTEDSKIKKAEVRLKELLNNDEVKLKGPVIFKEGRYALVSSVINPETGNSEKKLMAMGAAPVLQGSRIALSFELDPDRSTLLFESFKTATPDVSIVFDLTFSGIMDAYNAKMTVDWAEVQKNEKISGGANVYFVSAELEKIYEEMRRTSAIKLETTGQDDKMQVIVDEAYAKVTDMMFRRVEPEQLPPAAQNGLSSLLGGLIGSNGSLSSGKTFGFGAHFGYKRKDIKLSGFSVLNFNSRTSTDRHHYITFNIGDFYKKFGNDDKYFRTVSLYNPEFEMRQVHVAVDGQLVPEFDRMINSITVTLKKKHQNGSQTIREVTILKSAVAESRDLMMSYGSVGDTDREKWLNYEYKAQYNFLGGKTYQTDWKEQNNSMINLFVPYVRKIVKVEADKEILKAANVRAVSVRISYPFLGESKTIDFTVKPDDDLSQKYFDITPPLASMSMIIPFDGV